MSYPTFLGVFLTGLLCTITETSGAGAIPFVDGLWQGDVETSQGGSAPAECWASTTYRDGTTLTLANRKDGDWDLRLSNPDWRLPPLHQYTMVAQVDHYPRLHISAEARNQMLLEIRDIDHIHLLELIENGHTIDLRSDGFNEKYDLEGSAKVIDRLRGCFADR